MCKLNRFLQFDSFCRLHRCPYSFDSRLREAMLSLEFSLVSFQQRLTTTYLTQSMNILASTPGRSVSNWTLGRVFFNFVLLKKNRPGTEAMNIPASRPVPSIHIFPPIIYSHLISLLFFNRHISLLFNFITLLLMTPNYNIHRSEIKHL